MDSNNHSLIPPGMLMRVIEDKQIKIAYYNLLHGLAVDALDIELINGIRFDEIKHLNMFANLYSDLSGERPDLSEPEILKPDSFVQGVKHSIIIELDSHDFYTNIYFTDTNILVRNTFVRALTDEIRHAAKFNFMYTQWVEKKLLKGSVL